MEQKIDITKNKNKKIVFCSTFLKKSRLIINIFKTLTINIFKNGNI